MTPIDVGAGRVLIRQGTFGREFFVVVDGLATVSKDGRPITLMRPGDHFGEIALLYKVTRTATVQAISAMTIAVWEQRDFKEMLEIAPRVRGRLRHSIARIRRREPESFPATTDV